jgi:hypothetical protein
MHCIGRSFFWFPFYSIPTAPASFMLPSPLRPPFSNHHTHTTHPNRLLHSRPTPQNTQNITPTHPQALSRHRAVPIPPVVGLLLCLPLLGLRRQPLRAPCLDRVRHRLGLCVFCVCVCVIYLKRVGVVWLMVACVCCLFFFLRVRGCLVGWLIVVWYSGVGMCVSEGGL